MRRLVPFQLFSPDTEGLRSQVRPHCDCRSGSARGVGTALAARLGPAAAGLSAEKLALVVAVGFALGTFPVPGVATLLCAGAAWALRLNASALLAAGQLATPVQYALLVPCARLGARLAGAQAGVAGAALQAVSGWLCLCVPAGAALYLILACALGERGRASRTPAAAAA